MEYTITVAVVGLVGMGAALVYCVLRGQTRSQRVMQETVELLLATSIAAKPSGDDAVDARKQTAILQDLLRRSQERRAAMLAAANASRTQEPQTSLTSLAASGVPRLVVRQGETPVRQLEKG